MPRIKRGANNVCQCSNFSISLLIIGNRRCGSFSTLQSIYAKRVSISQISMTVETDVELDVDVGGFHQEFQNIAKQRNRLMRFFKRSYVPTDRDNQPQSNTAQKRDILDDPSPRQRVDLPLPIGRP